MEDKLPWKDGECMNWECHDQATTECWSCEMSYCDKHLLHFCCSGHDEGEYTCMCDDRLAGN